MSIEDGNGCSQDLGLAIPVSESVNIELFARYADQATQRTKSGRHHRHKTAVIEF